MVSRDIAKQLGQGSKRQVVGFDAAVDRHGGELGHQRPVAADGALDQTLLGQSVQPALFAVTRRRGEEQREIARRARIEKPSFERVDELVGRAAAHEAGARNGVAVANQGDSVAYGNDFVLQWIPAGVAAP